MCQSRLHSSFFVEVRDDGLGRGCRQRLSRDRGRNHEVIAKCLSFRGAPVMRGMV